MRRVLSFGFLMCIWSAAAGAQVVISQFYGGGGNAGATLRNDYVELFNRGAAPVDVTGWTLQYGSATGTGTFDQNMTAGLTGSIAPGAYYLVQLASSGSAGSTLPAADFSSSAINMSATAGKIILVNASTGLICNGSTAKPCSTADQA